MKKLSKKGFTVVELVIVIAVIAVLSAVLIPTFSSLTKKANLTADQQAVSQMNKILVMEESKGNKPSSLSDVNDILEEYNLVPDGYTPLTKDLSFYWDSKNNCIILWDVKNSEVVFPAKDYKDIQALSSDWRVFTSTSYTYIGNSLTEGGTITISEEINAVCSNRIASGMLFSGGKATTLDFQNNKYTYDVTYETGMNGAAISAIYVCDNANVTIENADLTSGEYGIYVTLGATLTIKSGNFFGKSTAVQVGNGTLNIEGGFFDSDSSTYLINCLDANYKDGSAKVIITGGTFVNFDPSNNAAEGENTNFVANGYKVISEQQSNGDTWYKVVAN